MTATKLYGVQPAHIWAAIAPMYVHKDGRPNSDQADRFSHAGYLLPICSCGNNLFLWPHPKNGHAAQSPLDGARQPGPMEITQAIVSADGMCKQYW